MSKLHELLAVHEPLKGQSKKVMADLIATFSSKPHLFEETRKTFEPFGENAKPETIEEKAIQTTVYKEIEFISKHIAKAIDIGYQVDIANSTASADVVTEDGETLLTKVPATALLQLEHRLKEVQDLVKAIKTVDPAKGFEPDANRGGGVYKARDVRKNKTEKQDKVVTLSQATDKHPANAILKTYDVPIGHLLEQEWSGLITPAIKADLIDRVEVAVRAVKTARAQANNVEIDTKNLKIGQTLLDYIFKPLEA